MDEQRSCASAARVALARIRLIVVLAISLAACRGVPSPNSDDPASTGPPSLGGRSICPGSVRLVASNLQGSAADAVEQLQAALEGESGFLAVVFDGEDPVVVVERPRLDEWRLREKALDIRVAPSCVDPALLASVRQVVSDMGPPDGAILSVGYDALRDHIVVWGADEADILRALDQLGTRAGSAARAAITDGILRFSP